MKKALYEARWGFAGVGTAIVVTLFLTNTTWKFWVAEGVLILGLVFVGYLLTKYK